MTLLILSFLAGILTILAPCVLPILPIILAGSLAEKSWKRPLIITLSLAFSIVAFTIFLKASTLLIDIPFIFWKYLSGIILIILGGIYIFPHMWTKTGVTLGFSKSSQILSNTQNISSKKWQGVATGFALGPVFSSCSPTYAFLLATVFPANFLSGIAYTFVYALGLSSILFIIAAGGQKVIKKLFFIADENGYFKKILGGIFIIVGCFIITGYDKKIEIWILNSCNANSIEQAVFDVFSPNYPQKNNTTDRVGKFLKNKKAVFKINNLQQAPIISNREWIGNSPISNPKVTLVFFWTFGCINCKHTLPYINSWYEKYHDKGLDILGIHSPEFAYEKERKNVETAIQREFIKFPVSMDNDFSIWKSFSNAYWPALYFIDTKGQLRHYHFGEGEYENSEQVIQELLAE